MHFNSTSITNPQNNPDNILNRWILITSDLNYNEWIKAYLHKHIKEPPRHPSCAGNLFYVESIQGVYAVGRFVESILSPEIMNLSAYEFEIASYSMVEPFLDSIFQKIKTQQAPPISVFPQVFKDYANEKISNETN
jgi:hypothetical protein